MSTRQSPRVIGLALAAGVALVALTGCGDYLPPSTASVVNGHRISTDQVDRLTRAQCAAADVAAKQGQSQTTALHRVEVFSLQLLLDTQLTEQYVRSIGVKADPEVTSTFYAQLKAGIATLPEQTRAELADVFSAWAQGRAALIEVGSQRTGQPVTPQGYQQLLDAGLQARQAWQKSVTITTAARFAPDSHGLPTDESGSVSRAVSDYARQSASSKPSPSWVSALPAGQRCG